MCVCVRVLTERDPGSIWHHDLKQEESGARMPFGFRHLVHNCGAVLAEH